MGYVVTKRILAFKSIMGFGKYQDITVNQCLSLNRDYISWSYFNVDGIGYLEDVLDYMGIDKEFRINKPGSDKEMWNKWMNNQRLKLDPNEFYKQRLNAKWYRKYEDRAKKSKRAISERIARQDDRRSSINTTKW